MDDLFSAFETAVSSVGAGVKRARAIESPDAAVLTSSGPLVAAVAPVSTTLSAAAAAPTRGRRELGAAVVDDIGAAGLSIGSDSLTAYRANARATFIGSAAVGGGPGGGGGAGGAAGAGAAGSVLTSVAMEIGESLRPALSRGETDDKRTTAPMADFSGTGGEGDESRGPPARVYPFTLDPFQQRSIACLERNESVLVSAHTSAGKTVVAEYAIAMALRDKQRVIYTSPIKALSNQKYRDFFEIFADVGLMTGDVTINSNASVLVMTTEILRSMLYRGSEVMREVKWVIYDEVHYMRDKERGVVWEESIILLPHKVRFVFLSATIPNAREFAEWVAKIHKHTCHVVYTDYRPTPLQHFIFPAGGEGVYLVVDEKGQFREDNFTKAMATLTSSALDDAITDVVDKGAGKKGRAKNSGARGKGGASDLYRIVKMVMERRYDPVIVFSFSKRECESYAMQLSQLDFATAEEKSVIEAVFTNAIASLSEDDKSLPQIAALLPLLLRGIGIHHGGLLPILKEVIEILFQESLLKILFATETFSMGINMPARTVIFTAARKFDGVDFRFISAGEYIQMSGRAGRRGLDDRGIVIQMIDEKMEPAAAMDILKGTADALNSAFHIGYNMLLNLLRLEGGDPERLMALSFHQFQLERAAPALEAAADEADLAANAAFDGFSAGSNLADIEDYAALTSALETVDVAVHEKTHAPAVAIPFLVPGRLVKGPSGWGWAVVVGVSRCVPPPGTLGDAVEVEAGSEGGGGASASGVAGGVKAGPQKPVVVTCLLHCALGGGVPRAAAVEDVAAGRAELRILPVRLSALGDLTAIKIVLPANLALPGERALLVARLAEVMRRFSGAPAALDPVSDLRLTDPAFRELLERRGELKDRLAASPLAAAPDVLQQLGALGEAKAARRRAEALREKARSCTVLAQRDVLRRKKRVLRRLGLLSADNVVQMKGRVAAEVNSADELLVTELIFSGAFNSLDAAGAAALLSVMVYQAKSTSEKDDKDKPAPLKEEFAGPLRGLQEAARRIATVSNDAGLEVNVDEYVASFNPGMMELVAAWVGGARFVDIAAMTKEFEGTIIRVIRRLEELTRQLGDAAKSIGDEALEAKFKDASAKMRRDIVFAASLYL